MAKKILDTVHSTVKGLHDAGIVDAATMRHFDELCVEPPREMTKTEIKKVRLSQKVSQPVFAKYLGVSPSTVQKWESGEKKPSKMALRFLHTVASHDLSVIPVNQNDTRHY